MDVAIDGETDWNRRVDEIRSSDRRHHAAAQDGWDVVAELRRDEVRTPFCFLPRRQRARSVKGSSWVPTIIFQTVRVPELLARVRSVLRRAPQQQPDICASRIWNSTSSGTRQRARAFPLNLTPKDSFCLRIWFAQPRRGVRRELQSTFGRRIHARQNVAMCCTPLRPSRRPVRDEADPHDSCVGYVLKGASHFRCRH